MDVQAMIVSNHLLNCVTVTVYISFIHLNSNSRMADWKLLSFYTASSGPAQRLDIRDDRVRAGGALSLNQDVSTPAPQEIFCTGNNTSSCVDFMNQVRVDNGTGLMQERMLLLLMLLFMNYVNYN